MMNFVTVVLAILVANVIWTVGAFALMGSMKFQHWVMKYTIKYMEKYSTMLEDEFEDEELA